MAKTTLRQRDAEAAKKHFATAGAALASLEFALGVWCDDVRADAEKRHETNEDAILWDDPEYKRALDAVGAIRHAKAKLAETRQAFNDSESKGDG